MAEREVFNPETGQYELYDPDRHDPNAQESLAAPTTTDPNAGWQNDWRWQLRTPPQAPREGYYWQWQGGFDENGQGWQEVPTGGWDSPNGQSIVDNQPPPPGVGGGEGSMGLAYWAARGYDENDIFDLRTGQLKPGWSRTANGYMFNGGGGNQFPPGGDVVGGGGGAYGGGGWSGSSGGFGGGSYQWPTYSPLNFDAGPAFTFREFVGPTGDTVLKDPGFQFRLDQGRKALEASAAGRGVLRSGGTLKDILGYGQNFASQEFGNVWNRALQEYDVNRGNAADIWSKQYGQRKDQYSFGEDANRFGFNARQRQAELDFKDQFDRWLAEGNWTRDIALGGID